MRRSHVNQLSRPRQSHVNQLSRPRQPVGWLASIEAARAAVGRHPAPDVPASSWKCARRPAQRRRSGDRQVNNSARQSHVNSLTRPRQQELACSRQSRPPALPMGQHPAPDVPAVAGSVLGGAARRSCVIELAIAVNSTSTMRQPCVNHASINVNQRQPHVNQASTG